MRVRAATWDDLPHVLAVVTASDVAAIGEALLRTAFVVFWRRGERRVALGVAAYSEAAARLYERAGMRRLYTIALYEKELRPSS